MRWCSCFFTMANVGLPGTSGFCRGIPDDHGRVPGEHLGRSGCCIGCYLFGGFTRWWLYRRVVMGDLIKESLRTITDMSGRERWIFAPLVAMTLLLGVYPALGARYNRALGRRPC